MWKLNDAIEEIKQLEPKLAAVGFHCALTGSVLYKGESIKDLDLVIYPHNKNGAFDTDWQPARDCVKNHFKSAFIKDCGGTSQIRDDKKVSWISDELQRRIDLFFLE